MTLRADWTRRRRMDWPGLRDRAVELNQLDEEAWMGLPIALRVALDVLNPETSGYGRTELEKELALYIVDALGRRAPWTHNTGSTTHHERVTSEIAGTLAAIAGIASTMVSLLKDRIRPYGDDALGQDLACLRSLLDRADRQAR